jgi:hypothetical protein
VVAKDLLRGRVMDKDRGDWSVFNADNISELRGLSEQEIIRRHDALVDHANSITTMMGAKTPFLNHAQTYTNELLRRENVRQGERMETLTRSRLNHLTWWIVALTVLIAIATIIGVALTAWTLLSGA